MNIDEMPAGREMDALVAEKVMGWHWKDAPNTGCRILYDAHERKAGLIYYAIMPQVDTAWKRILPDARPSDSLGKWIDAHYWPGGEENARKLPCYSTDIAAAWDVLDAVSNFRSGCPPINDKSHPAKDGRSAFYKPVVSLSWYEHDGDASVIIGRCKGVGMDDDIRADVWEAGHGDDGPKGSAQCVALAICRAALKAVL